jgi:hypothetical protein
MNVVFFGRRFVANSLRINAALRGAGGVDELFRLQYNGPSLWENGAVHVQLAGFEEQAAEHRFYTQTMPVRQVDDIGHYSDVCVAGAVFESS